MLNSQRLPELAIIDNRPLASQLTILVEQLENLY